MAQSDAADTAQVAPKPAPSPSTEAAKALAKDLSASSKGKKWLIRLGVVGALGGLVAGGFAWRNAHKPPPPARYITAQVTEGDVLEVVQSTGAVKPLTEVQVGAQVSGRVVKVHVDFNSQVKKGDLLAEIDPLTFSAAVQQQSAQYNAQKASLARAKANAVAQKANLDRLKKLAAENLASQSEVDVAQGQYDVGQADIAQAQAQIAANQAGMASASANLSFTRIFSPINGVVTDRAIDPGQTVASSFTAPVLFTIAEDLSKMRVLADIDEADVGKISEGMTAETQVDAFPGEKFAGQVSQVRYAPTTVSGVVTYQAVVLVDNPDKKLRPGMTATVTVKAKEALHALRVPNAALRFKPTVSKTGKGDRAGKGETGAAPTSGKASLRPHEKALDAKHGRVFVLTDETPGAEKIEPKIVEIGITDGVNTEILGDVLAKDSKVVTDETDDASATSSGMPSLFGGGKKGGGPRRLWASSRSMGWRRTTSRVRPWCARCATYSSTSRKASWLRSSGPVARERAR
jgi:HlyD family secretion protein